MRALLALLLSCIAFPVMAQEVVPQQPEAGMGKCGPTEIMRAQHKRVKWKEVETSIGITGPKTSYISIFVSPLGETWTIMVSTANGMSCIVSEGTMWMQGEVPTGDPA